MEIFLHDESELFRLIAAGDEYAFRQIFELHKSGLVAYLHTFTKSREEAKELAQDVFLKLWMKRERLAAVESPRKYLFTIARNSALDFLRKASVDNKMREHLWKTISEHQRPDEEQEFARDRSRQVQEAMLKLSRRKQTVFRLSRLEGLTHEQIAAQLRISKNTVKNHIIASLKFIRNYVSAN